MCASKGTVPYRVTEQAQNAAYQQLMATRDAYQLTRDYQLTRKAINDNLYKAEYDPRLARYDQTPPLQTTETSPEPKEPIDSIEARFKGLILEEEKK